MSMLLWLCRYQAVLLNRTWNYHTVIFGKLEYLAETILREQCTHPCSVNSLLSCPQPVQLPHTHTNCYMSPWITHFNTLRFLNTLQSASAMVPSSPIPVHWNLSHSRLGKEICQEVKQQKPADTILFIDQTQTWMVILTIAKAKKMGYYGQLCST